ncbi:CvpA family protein [Candidatus Mesenet endosymbiont of Agriotes lineatus]|uniref:CvpA family protein n=1 Tax=Candidatus Mesenet endosymbiont of Agriotes lineatus TaxID=3077948 RepID=UPI0030CC7A93
MFDVIVIFVIILCVFVAFMRGGLKELFGLVGMFLSVILTINHFDFFKMNYMSMKYMESELVANILSTISIFVIVTVAIIIVNSWIMYVLSPIRLGATDRLSGIFVGALKGIIFSSIIFFTIEVYYFTFYTKSDNKGSSAEDVLPGWLIDSHFYPMFHAIENSLNTYVPQSIYSKIEKLGSNLKDAVDKKLQEKDQQEEDKQKNKEIKKHKRDKGLL